MKVLIFDDMSQCTDDEVNRMLAHVSEQRRKQALQFKFTFGRFACLKSALMLQEMLRQMDRIASDESVTFDYGPHGKPLLLGQRDIHFNISHCKRGIAVAVHDNPVGIDIECRRVADEALLRRTMNDEERRVIALAPDPQFAFVQYWTKKESVLKLRGTGLVDDLYGVLQGQEHVETHTEALKGYAWSVAVGG